MTRRWSVIRQPFGTQRFSIRDNGSSFLPSTRPIGLTTLREFRGNSQALQRKVASEQQSVPAAFAAIVILSPTGRREAMGFVKPPRRVIVFVHFEEKRGSTP